MSAAVEIDGRVVTLNEVSGDVTDAIEACEGSDYRRAIRALCRELERLSLQITELSDELYGE